MVRIAVMSLLLCCMANTGQAEGLLRRIFGAKDTGSYGSSCPGGICPTASGQRQFTPVANIVSAPLNAVDNVRGHWTYPGTIDNHLEYDHGVSTAGMSRQEKLNYHDRLHEGTANQVLQSETIVTMVPRANYVEQYQSNYPSRSSVGNSSFGGGSSGGFAVGKMYKGEMVVAIGQTVSAPQAEVSASESKAFGGVFDGMRSRRAFRQVATEAAKRKLDAGDITQDQFDNFTFAIHIPRIAAEMQESLESKAVNDGVFGSAQAINWDNFERMIELVIKYLPMLLKLFAENERIEQTATLMPYVSIEKPNRLPSVYDLVFGYVAA